MITNWQADGLCFRGVSPLGVIIPFREMGGEAEGCLSAGNMTMENKKTAPNILHSEPSFCFELNFQFRRAFPLTLLLIDRWLHFTLEI
jgi:hypothetical protein